MTEKLKKTIRSMTISNDETLVDTNEKFDIICKKCGTSRLFVAEEYDRCTRVLCKCQTEQYQIDLARENADALNEKFIILQRMSNMGGRYKDASFDTMDMHDADQSLVDARKKCINYCLNWRENIKSGKSLFMFGSVGTGKTHLMCCIANEMMKHGYSCLITNMTEITSQILKGNAEFLDKAVEVDYLCLDDLGTERLTVKGEESWTLEKLQQIIDSRYSNAKPIIITSNLSFSKLIEKGAMTKTIDRLYEICERIRVDGKSYRQKSDAKAC